MNALYLTADEQKVFSTLPAKIREGWEVQEERDAPQDIATHRAMRMQLVHLHDPTLLAFVKRGSALADMNALVELIATTNLRAVDEADLAELCFALGPVPLTALIGLLLTRVRTDDDAEGIQAIALIRHSLLEAMQPSAS